EGGSIWWSVHGRNKRCVTANLKSAEGIDLVKRLIAQSEVVIENYRPGRLERLGLGTDAIADARPGVTIVRISGYGQTGPQASLAGFGVIGEAKGGLRYLCAHASDQSDLPPVRTGTSIGDAIAGLYGALGALAAVIEQRATGRTDPRILDVALGESVLSLMEGILPEYAFDGTVRQPAGSRLPTASPSNAYRTRDDEWVLIAANSEHLFRTLCDVMGQPSVASDERFTSNPRRVENDAAIDAIIGSWTKDLSADEVVDLLEEANIPVSKVYSIADVAADQQYLARDMIATVDDPRLGQTLHPGVVPVVEGLDRNAQIRWPGPSVGEHNGDVYGELLGLDSATLEKLKTEGAI
ncbi:MAG: CoA transferase, partial [Pseudomonadota bacterium]